MTTATIDGPFPVPDDKPGFRGGNHAGAVRTCDTTGLPVCLTAQLFIKKFTQFASSTTPSNAVCGGGAPPGSRKTAITPSPGRRANPARTSSNSRRRSGPPLSPAS